LPAAQAVHDAAPDTTTNLPAEQSTHPLWRDADWYLPTAHEEQVVASALLYLPVPQDTQEVIPVELFAT